MGGTQKSDAENLHGLPWLRSQAPSRPLAQALQRCGVEELGQQPEMPNPLVL